MLCPMSTGLALKQEGDEGEAEQEQIEVGEGQMKDKGWGQGRAGGCIGPRDELEQDTHSPR